jgi:hypothetical protein
LIKTLEAKVGQILPGFKYQVRRGIVVQEQHTFGDFPARGDFPSKCPSIAPAEMSNTQR